MDRSERRARAIERMRDRQRAHPHAPLPIPVVLAIVFAPFLLVGALWTLGYVTRPRPGYGYPADEARTYRIVQVVPERRPQPVLADVSDVRFHLEDHGISCEAFEEMRVEPNPEGLDLSGEVHVWGECGGGRLLLYRYSHQPSKVSHLEDRAYCSWTMDGNLAPYKPNYWLEGPNWTVVLARGIRSDDASTRSAAQLMAHRTGARLYRSCAPSARYPARPILTTALGRTVRIDPMFGGDPYAVTVQGATRSPVGDTGMDRMTVALTVASGEPTFFGAAVHSRGSESYWNCADPDPTTGSVTCTVPSGLTDPLLRFSTAQEGEVGPHHIRDFELR